MLLDAGRAGWDVPQAGKGVETKAESSTDIRGNRRSTNPPALLRSCREAQLARLEGRQLPRPSRIANHVLLAERFPCGAHHADQETEGRSELGEGLSMHHDGDDPPVVEREAVVAGLESLETEGAKWAVLRGSAGTGSDSCESQAQQAEEAAALDPDEIPTGSGVRSSCREVSTKSPCRPGPRAVEGPPSATLRSGGVRWGEEPVCSLLPPKDMP